MALQNRFQFISLFFTVDDAIIEKSKKKKMCANENKQQQKEKRRRFQHTFYFFFSFRLDLLNDVDFRVLTFTGGFKDFSFVDLQNKLR